MKRRPDSFLIIIALLLLTSIGINIYQMVKANEQQARIINFIPQAVNLQDENLRLQAVEENQKLQIEDLSYFKDSILQLHPAAPVESQSPVMNTQPANPGYNPKPNTDQTFRDLNKNIP